MYQEVVLPQPYRTQLPGKLAPSSLTCFLRTMLKRPELGARVSKLAVWVWKGKLIRSSVDPKKESFCACGTCMKALSPLVDRLKLSSREKEGWTRDLSGPTEAAVRALIFTSLPNLKTLELSAKPLPIRKDEASELLARFQKSNLLDVSRLAQGLAITSVTTLTLSANLNGISVARLPAVTTLTLDYSESNPFVTVCKGHFANITTLKIQPSPMAKINHAILRSLTPSFAEYLKSRPSSSNRQVLRRSAPCLSICKPSRSRTHITVLWTGCTIISVIGRLYLRLCGASICTGLGICTSLMTHQIGGLVSDSWQWMRVSR
jgi:hypothetical protein